MPPILLALFPLALFSLCTAAAAQDRLETRSGKVYEGRVVSDDGQQVEFQTRDGMTLKLPHDSLTTATRYRLRQGATSDDPHAQLELAEWCVDQTLYEEARRHYKAALAKDPALADEVAGRVTAARHKAGEELLARARSLQADGRPDEARQILGTLVQELPDEPAAKEASKLLAEDAEQRKRSALERPARTGGAEPAVSNATRPDGTPFSAATRELFQPVVGHYHDMLDHTREGLLESGRSGSIKQFEKALDDGAKARKAVEKLRARQADDAEISDALVLVDQKLGQAFSECRVHLADAYLLRKSYNQAAEVVDAGLADDPDNGQLRQCKDRILAASSGGDDDVWIIRRGGLGARR